MSAPLKPDPWRIVVENGSLTLEVIRWKEAVREKAPHRFLSRGTAQAWIDRQEKEARTFEPMRSAGLPDGLCDFRADPLPASARSMTPEKVAAFPLRGEH